MKMECKFKLDCRYKSGVESYPIEIDMSLSDSGNFSASASVYKIKFNIRIQDYEEDFVMGGQCFDELKESSPEIANDPKFKQIYSWWKRYHLNNMHAGTEKQESALDERFGDKYPDYTEQCAYLEKIGLLYDFGYKYGTSWLKREIPSEIQNQMREFIKANMK